MRDIDNGSGEEGSSNSAKEVDDVKCGVPAKACGEAREKLLETQEGVHFTAEIGGKRDPEESPLQVALL